MGDRHRLECTPEFTGTSHDSCFLQFAVNLAANSLQHTSRLISPYVLKTVALYEWMLNPEKEQWFGNKLSLRLLDILRSLVDHQ